MPRYMDTMGLTDTDVQAALTDFGSVHVAVDCSDCRLEGPALLTPSDLLVPAGWHANGEVIFCGDCSRRHVLVTV